MTLEVARPFFFRAAPRTPHRAVRAPSELGSAVPEASQTAGAPTASAPAPRPASNAPRPALNDLTAEAPREHAAPYGRPGKPLTKNPSCSA